MSQLPTTRDGKPLALIMQDWWTRRIQALPWHEHVREMSDHYNDRIVIPMPEIDKDERPAVANLIAQRLDQHAMRVASRQPSVVVPPTDSTKKAETQARRRRLVLSRYDDVNEIEIFDGRRARWLATWSSAPVILRPDPIRQAPVWELRNPLGVYPAPRPRYDDMRPDDLIATYTQTYGWLQNHHPQIAQAVQAASRPGVRRRDDDRVEIVEYVDAEVTVLACIGVAPAPEIGLLGELGVIGMPLPGNPQGQTWAVELLRIPNLAETCTAVVPGRVALDCPRGLADGMLGIFQMQAKLYALYANAVARGIYPDLYFIHDSQGGQIITPADGLQGIIGEIEGGSLTEMGKGAGVQTTGLISDLNQQLRVEGSLPSEWSGMSQSNVRTAQRGMDIASNAVSYYIQEDQRVIARAKRHEYEIAAAIDRGYFKNTKKSFYVEWGKDKGTLEYTPGDLWSEIPELKVKYFYAGMDQAGLAALVAQKMGSGQMSHLTGMRHDPSIDDPEAEMGRITAERLDEAILSAAQQQANTGQIQLTDLVRIKVLVKSGMDVEDAMIQAQKEAQQRQATPAPPGAPETQPGLQAGQAAQPAIAAPNPSQVDLKNLVRAIAAGSKVVA